MGRFIKERSKKAGLPPGSLIHIGEKSDKIRVTVIEYDETQYREKEIVRVEECLLYKGRETVTWINIEGLHEIGILTKIGECFGLHPLVLEDILNTDQRPKIEDYGDYSYIVLKMLHGDQAKGGVLSEQVSIILGVNFVISFQEGMKGDVFDPIRERIRSEKSRVRRMKADYLAYTLLDAIVDHYFAVLERLGERLELLEGE